MLMTMSEPLRKIVARPCVLLTSIRVVLMLGAPFGLAFAMPAIPLSHGNAILLSHIPGIPADFCMPYVAEG
jgi:hypothetical protein